MIQFDLHSQKVAIRIRGHDKPRLMGVAIAIYPYIIFKGAMSSTTYRGPP